MALEQTMTAEQEAHDHATVAGSSTEVPFVISLGPSYLDAAPEQVAALLPWLRTVVGSANPEVLVGYPVTHAGAVSEQHDGFVLQPFLGSAGAPDVVVQTATAWLNAYELVRAHGARCCLLLGGEAQTFEAHSAASLMDAVCNGGADLAVPRYDLPTNQGLLNAAVLSPLSRAVFNADLRFPLALDFACSARMAERMAAAAQRFTASSQPDALVWPVGEAAVSGYTLAEIPSGSRAIPQTEQDLGTILSRVAGSMFADIEAKATFWQRTRPAAPVLRSEAGLSAASLPSEPASSDEIQSLIESFRVGYSNLHEIWSLVLPPNTLVALKRLATAPADTFQLPDSTWVRIVYDFVLAHRLRTIARNHLMGAFAPLYLAWVASHLAQNRGDAHVDALARAFEADKPYLVSRWRWPDRFNP
jgi:glucosylglycerate synthase